MNSLPRFTLLAPLCLALVLAGSGCSDEDESCTEEGAAEVGGPRCCAGGCGNSTEHWSPRVCKDGEWVCQGSTGTIEYACASPQFACTTMEFCGKQGIGTFEQDPAPELCCFPDPKGAQCCEQKCDKTRVKHRECKTGVRWECPAGTIPISRCKDYATACGGILDTYRQNGYKL